MDENRIDFIIKGHELAHDVQTIIQVFYPNKHYYQVEEPSTEAITIESCLEAREVGATLYKSGILIDSYAFPCNKVELTEKEKKRVIKASIYGLLKKEIGTRPQWGFLTGVRPAKTVNELINNGYSDAECLSWLTDKYDVMPQKADLALEVAKSERKLLAANGQNDISIYIGIPFCPTRCLYCSFTAYPLAQYQNRVDEYLDALIKELEFLGEYSKRYRVRNVYIGGGTPTSLTEGQMERLFSNMERIFPMLRETEFTVEAGRPDTITVEKLKLMKDYGVNRISINPQSMNEDTLLTVGRRHTVEDIRRVFYEARKMGHDNINMDLILGLPGENAKEVEHTMKEIAKLAPDNVTVHTLAVKRASRLKENFDLYTMTDGKEMEKMLEISSAYAKEMGMKPYYMYRQKNMVGNFENVGYCLSGKEGVYNIQIMEEKQTILAAGAGASTKVVNLSKNKIERIFNVKSVEEYIGRIDEMIQRKKDGLPMNGDWEV